MNVKMEEKILRIITEAKQLASTHTFAEVMPNSADNNPTDVGNEYAKQLNITNLLRQKKKDLAYLTALLTEAKMQIDSNTPAGSKALRKVNGYLETIKCLAKVYQDLDDGQWWILNYYSKGGGML